MTVIEVADRFYGAAIKRTEPVRLPRMAAPLGVAGLLPPVGGPRPTGGLLGRDRELALIGALVDDLAAGGRALLLSGAPGVGKSALLDVAEETAATAGLRVLRAAGAQSEDVSFGVLNQLLLPLRCELDRLDDWQRNALSVALGFSEGPAGERLVVSNAVLALLLLAAGDAPLLLIVDDLHWLDQASARVLGFVARRLRGSRIGLIGARRTGATGSALLDVPGHDVRPLDDDASARLLAARCPGLAPAVGRRIVTEADGNVLVQLELLAGLTDQQRSGQAALPSVLPLTARLAAHLRDQPRRRAWLLAGAAVEPDATAPDGRAPGSGTPSTVTPPAGAARTLSRASRPGTGRTGHPPDRTAVGHLPDRTVVGHLPDPAAVGHLPDRTIVGRVPDPAAVGRVPDRAALGHARRLATAAYLAASALGDLTAAEALLADARRVCAGTEGPPEIALATAFVLLHSDGDVAAAARLLPPETDEQWKAALPGGGPLGRPQALEIRAMIGRLSGRAEDAEPPASPSAATVSGSGTLVGGAVGPCTTAPDGTAEPVGAAALQADLLRAFEAYQTGQWDDAWRLAEAVAERCASHGYQLLRRHAEAVLALVAACRGETERARALADEVARWAGPRSITSLLAAAHYADGLAALAQSDFRTAYLQAVTISAVGDVPAGAPCAAWALLDLVEAALRTDRGDEAVAHAQAARRAGLATASPRMALLSTAVLAMTAPDDEAAALFERALAAEGAQRWPFDRARVRLLYGERLRRVRAVTAARAQLSAAVDEFRRLGAPTWADRAATALRATGQVRQSPDNRDYQELTVQELQIARLAAQGLSNKQIGERLYMSHRTVGSHLYRIFPKLGIASRAALSGALPPQAG